MFLGKNTKGIQMLGISSLLDQCSGLTSSIPKNMGMTINHCRNYQMSIGDNPKWASRAIQGLTSNTHYNMELNTYKSQDSVYPQEIQIKKMKKRVDTGQEIEVSYENVTLATPNDYFNLVAKVSEENRDSLRVTEELGFEYYTERILVKL